MTLDNFDIDTFLRVHWQKQPLLSRFSFVREGANRLLIFVDGQTIACGEAIAGLAEQMFAQ